MDFYGGLTRYGILVLLFSIFFLYFSFFLSFLRFLDMFIYIFICGNILLNIIKMKEVLNMTLEQTRDFLINELEVKYNNLSEAEIADMVIEINSIDAYLDECKYLNSL